jgi:hypothetical protein
MDIQKNQMGLYEVTIDSKIYQFEKWGADESLDVLLELVPIIGKPLGAFASAFVDKKPQDGEGLLDKEIKPEMISVIFEALTQSFNKKVVKELIIKLSSQSVLCQGAKINFRTHYQDQLDLMFKVVYAALEVQYGNFFGALLGIVNLSRKPMVSNQGM